MKVLLLSSLMWVTHKIFGRCGVAVRNNVDAIGSWSCS